MVAVRLDHTVVVARDNHEGAQFLAEILGLKVGHPSGPFVPVVVSNGVTLDFYTAREHEERFAHLAFLVSEDGFDHAMAVLITKQVSFCADPQMSRPGEINHNDGGRGVYFLDQIGNTMEIITVPYGGWPTDEAST
jgi:catechol 2,3-dioxygenase-like lactoylglutathione lyase family enzyme